MTTYLTTTIPYVNAAPHIGFALEAVQADTLARHLRARGEPVRLLSGTDDNSLKNVLSAEAAGRDTRSFVDANADAFAALQGPLSLSYDDFIRTSRDPRHRVGVEALWRACHAAGDLYRGRYQGLYCVGCEHYLADDDLVAGACPEHAAPPVQLSEENWFFRLSRYAEPLRDAVASGRLRVTPEARRNEVLAVIDAGLRDFSVSRDAARARGWGIAVPGDPGQVVYVWWDALGNYITSLGYGADTRPLSTWWTGADRRVHLLGKGVIRFHAIYWPAMLLSAGLPLPTELVVHDYLTAGGRKIAKSDGTVADPVALAATYGTDALRWWLLRDVPRTGDTDFTTGRLADRAAADLTGGFGNLTHRVLTMLHRFRDGVPVTAHPEPDTVALRDACAAAPGGIDAALALPDFRAATGVLCGLVDEANRLVDRTRPWELSAAAKGGDDGAGRRLDAVLGALLEAVTVIAAELRPFLPDAAARIAAQLAPEGGRLPVPVKVFG